MAVVRLCRLDELLSVGQLVQALSQPGAVAVPVPTVAASGRQVAAPPEAAAGAKKNGPLTASPHVNGDTTQSDVATVTLSESNLPDVTGRLIHYLADKSPILANHLKLASSYAIFGPNALAVRFDEAYNHAYEACASEGNTRRLQDALSRLTGQPALVRVERVTGAAAPANLPPAPTNGTGDRKKTLMDLPLFRRATEALGAQIWHVDDEFNPDAAPRQPGAAREPDPDTDEA